MWPVLPTTQPLESCGLPDCHYPGLVPRHGDQAVPRYDAEFRRPIVLDLAEQGTARGVEHADESNPSCDNHPSLRRNRKGQGADASRTPKGAHYRTTEQIQDVELSIGTGHDDFPA